MGPHPEQSSTNPVAVHPNSIRTPPPPLHTRAPFLRAELTDYLPTNSISFFLCLLFSFFMGRIIFGSVFPLLIFTGYSRAKKKKKKSLRKGERGFIKKSNEWLTLLKKREFPRNCPKILLWVYLGLV